MAVKGEETAVVETTPKLGKSYSELALEVTVAAGVGGLICVASGGTAVVPIVTACGLGALSAIGERGVVEGTKTLIGAVNEHILHSRKPDTPQADAPAVAASPLQEPILEQTISKKRTFSEMEAGDKTNSPYHAETVLPPKPTPGEHVKALKNQQAASQAAGMAH